MTENVSLVLAAQKFFAELRENNNREWFQAHKSEYEQQVRDPGKFFSQLVAAELEDLTGKPHNPKIFRINRDIRFSKDKTPYNTHLHILWSPDVQIAQAPGWFLGISPDYVKIGGGIMAFEGDMLNRYRKAVDEAGGEGLASLIANIDGAEFVLGEPELKRVPSPYDKDHINADLLRRKGITLWRDVDEAAQQPDSDLLQIAMSGFRDFKPLFDWLMDLGKGSTA